MPATAYCTNPELVTLENDIRTLCAHIQAATYRLLVLVREFDERDGWHGDGVLSCAHWLNWQCGIGLVAAREKVRVAHALAHLPRISEAFSKGETSYSKVRAMTRVATPENEATLLDYARHSTAAHVERLARLYRRHGDASDRDREERQQAARSVRWHYDEDGSLVLHARLPAEEGGRVLAALSLAGEAVREDDSAESRRAHDSAESPPADTLAGQPRGVTWGGEWPAPAERRRADALLRLADTVLAGGLAGCPPAERHLVTVHVDAGVLKGHRDEGRCDLDHGPALTPQAARRLACDASVVPLVEDARGNVLDVGRRTRSVPPALQRALKARDDTCRFPGCTRRHGLEAHHVVHWANGGETSLGNLARLCRFHHKLVHEGGYAIERLDDGALRFVGPNRRFVPDAPPAPPLEPGVTVESLNAAESLAIDARTGRCRWEGYAPDWSDAVLALAERDDGMPAWFERALER